LKVWAKEGFSLCASLFVHWGSRVCRRAPELLTISRLHARQVQKSFCF